MKHVKVLCILISFSSFQSSFYNVLYWALYYFRNQKQFFKKKEKEKNLKIMERQKKINVKHNTNPPKFLHARNLIFIFFYVCLINSRISMTFLRTAFLLEMSSIF